jgi:hypothetical protein
MTDNQRISNIEYQITNHLHGNAHPPSAQGSQKMDSLF